MMSPIRAVSCLAGLCCLFGASAHAQDDLPMLPAGEPTLLTDPYLQNPDERSVSVVWLTNFEGRGHRVVARGHRGAVRTEQLFRLLEDGSSKLEAQINEVSRRPVWRHEARIHGLNPGQKLEYSVVSITENGESLRAGPFTLQAAPATGQPLKILLTSDQQERFNTLANYQKVEEQFPDLDAVFFAGDLANHPRRGSEWFDNFRSSWLDNPSSANPAFFAAIQGRFSEQVPSSPYRGGRLIQNAPLFPSVANHEVSGRYRPNETYVLNGSTVTANINSMFGDPQPRWYAELQYEDVKGSVNPGNDPAIAEQWIRDHSNDFETYRDLFTLPDNGPEGEAYYAKKFGDVFLISMNISRIWRSWNVGPNDRSKFVEMLAESNHPENWGFGEHIFTAFAEGSAQYQWLQRVLKSQDFQNSRYRIVMFHQSAFGLGDNAVPVLTDPLMHIQYTADDGSSQTLKVLMPQDSRSRQAVFKNQVEPLLGRIEEVRYEYPLEADYFRRDIEPLLQAHGVQLVLTGHSHVWNRSKVGALNYLETSNVGNCFGAYWTQPDGTPWRDALRFSGYASFTSELALGQGVSRWDPDNYPRTNDAQDRLPLYPTQANPMMLFEGEPEPVPFVCSNNISTFSILDTAAGLVRSYAFDVRDPEGEVVEFDRFPLQED